ncbi:DEAD/DEAH box helicase family protein [Bradyrhizobium cenepequi]|uniref:DEAD/DEAH box helicase family protein n=1 Tax=Bradyrhizobium cenepequi TaxID=2821403 RepID=UPI00201BD4BD|nr:DEAD/DEAH box helicase family protein [Bradyrhizobium cenepequi]
MTGRRRVLLTLCTGVDKTAVAFQIAWRLWNAGWNKRGDFRKPRILFLADRNILVDDPMGKTFAWFGDARFKTENGVVSHRSQLVVVSLATPRAGLPRKVRRSVLCAIFARLIAG